MLRRSREAMASIRFNNLALLLLCLALGASLASGGFRTEQATAQGASTTTPQEQKALLQALENAFTSIADQVEPSVVTITARSTVRPAAADDQRRGGGGNDDDPQDGPFSLPDLFRRFNSPQPRTGPSTGSGFIIRRRGNEAFVL